MSRDEVERATTTLSPSRQQFGAYTSTWVPRPHDAFESYTFLFTNTHGLCHIAAIGKDIAMDALGTQVQTEFKSLQAALTAKYGQPTLHDLVQRGSIWNEPQDWAMALLQEERVLAAIWAYEQPRPQDRITAISLRARALSPTKAYITMAYDFENTEACRKEIAAAQNSVL